MVGVGALYGQLRETESAMSTAHSEQKEQIPLFGSLISSTFIFPSAFAQSIVMHLMHFSFLNTGAWITVDGTRTDTGTPAGTPAGTRAGMLATPCALGIWSEDC